MTDFDLIIRGGTIVDGTGADPFVGDIGIRDGVVVAIGQVAGRATETIDAHDLIVTPGFVDIHTHYDGHITWASRLEPSSNHGVTTVVTGNCGVGFAPCRPEDRDRLIGLMEGVEDIPGPVLTRGLPWTWESFPAFLDAVESRQFDVDVGVQVPHAPVRVFVMGERGAAGEAATADEIDQMRAVVREAVAAGGLGFTTSRSINHRAADGSATPSLKATEDELTGIALGLTDAGAGVLQLISDFDDTDREFAMLRRVAATSGRPMSMSLMQLGHAPRRWRTVLDHIEAANADGLSVKAQVCGRPVGTLAGLDLSFHPFSFCPAYQEIAGLPIARRVTALRQAARRARILAEFPGTSDLPVAPVVTNLANAFPLGTRPDYEPRLSDSIVARAERLGIAPADHAYDLLLAEDGHAMLYLPAMNYADGDMAAAEEMLRSPHTILGLGDGGAHCGIICDASFTTHMLVRWREPLGLPAVVKALTSDTAAAVCLHDRGRIARGFRADLNLIDLPRLRLHKPELRADLPDNGSRLHQQADGYVATIVAGIVTRRRGQPTGALPGRLVRGAQPAPGLVRDAA